MSIYREMEKEKKKEDNTLETRKPRMMMLCDVVKMKMAKT